jgi:hypothetical protein
MLENQRWELFAQGLAKGLTQGEAYLQAGYKRSPSAPSRLFENVRIKDRVQELIGRQAVNVVINKQYLMEAAIENLEKALGRKPVKIGAEAREIYVYRGDVANRVLQMLGPDVGLFIERRDVKHSVSEFDKYTDLELVQMLAREAQALLEDRSGGERSDDEQSIG